MARPLRVTLSLVLLSFAALGGSAVQLACSHAHTDDHTHDDTGTTADPCIDFTHKLVGTFTDEACRAVLDVEAAGGIVTDKSKAPTFTAPLAGAKVGLTPPPKFVWTRGTLALAKPSLLRRLGRALSPISVAWAHGDITGDGFVLTFKDKSGKELQKVMTDQLEFTPDDKMWEKLRASGTLSVSLVGIRFVKNAIAPGTKPTTGDVLTLTIG